MQLELNEQDKAILLAGLDSLVEHAKGPLGRLQAASDVMQLAQRLSLLTDPTSAVGKTTEVTTSGSSSRSPEVVSTSPKKRS